MSPARMLARVWSNARCGWLTQDGRGYSVYEADSGWFFPAFAHEMVSAAGTEVVEGFEVPAMVALYAWTSDRVMPAGV